MMDIRISPSLLAADFSRLGEEARAMEAAGADMLHLDVMDGHFVPNLTIGPVVLRSLRRATGLFFDTHLMLSQPRRYIESFAKAGADLITFHCEAEGDPAGTIALIRAAGCRAAVSLRPKTPAEAVFPLLPLVDMVLVMTVEPGFGGQSFMEDMLPKIAALRAQATRLGLPLDIQVDGGIDLPTAPLVAKAGANVLVAGTALFSKPDYTVAVSALRASATV